MIRMATPGDAAPAIRMIYDTIGQIGNNLADTDDPSEAIKILEEFFKLRGNRLSYENTMVKLHNGEVVGVLVSYPGNKSVELDEPFVDYAKAKPSNESKVIPREADEDEYYLDTVAVSAKFQGRGYGTELVYAFEERALKSGHLKLGLLVEPSNTIALKLYKRIGYVADVERVVGPYTFLHMVKHLTL